MQLSWPREGAMPPDVNAARFSQPASNICLDFHGDPRISQLVVFSDGNHHMALAEVLALLRLRCPPQLRYCLNSMYIAEVHTLASSTWRP